MKIIVLGSGCCDKGTTATVESVEKVLGELGLDAEVTTVNDVATVIGYGVMSTPALVIDDQVVHAGSVPSAEQLTHLLTAGAQ